jgi:hypothetical protein
VVNPSGRIGYKGVAEVMAHAFFNGVDWQKVKNRTEKPPMDTYEEEVKQDGSFGMSMPADYPVHGFTYEAHSPAPGAAYH